MVGTRYWVRGIRYEELGDGDLINRVFKADNNYYAGCRKDQRNKIVRLVLIGGFALKKLAQPMEIFPLIRYPHRIRNDKFYQHVCEEILALDF